MGVKGLLKKAKKLELKAKKLELKANKLELKAKKKNKINPDRIPLLEEILRDVHVICRPKPIDYHNRKDLVRIFNLIAKEIYGNSGDVPVVEEFGSFLMDIFTAKSDLDLSVNFSNKEGDFPREKKIKSLRKFSKKFYALKRKGHVSSVQPILTAKVPILKVVDRGTGIECDISIENRDGILKSQIVQMISSIDERFPMLSFLMKAWAKAHDINSSKDRTMNSLSIISLVAFHLQTRDPPILPPFSVIFKDGTDPASVRKIVNDLLSYGKRNKESLGELFVTLLIKLASVETLWPKGLCASVYEASWIFKKWDSPLKEKTDSKFGCISVEDFTDRSQNVARAVGKTEVTTIYKFIDLSIFNICAFMDGQIQGTKLREFLFGRESIPSLEEKSTTNFARRTGESSSSLDPNTTKKGRVETQGAIPFKIIQPKIVQWGGRPTEGWGGTPEEALEGRNVASHLDHIQPKMMQTKVGWRGIQQSVLPGPIPTKETLSTEGNRVCYASTTLLPTQNPIGTRNSGGSLLLPSLPPHNPWGFDGSHRSNEMVPMPPVGPVYAQHDQPGHHQNTGHGPHSNGYGSW